MIFSLKILKNYIYDVIFGAVDILSTGSCYMLIFAEFLAIMFCSIIEETALFLLIKSISIEKQRFANLSMF